MSENPDVEALRREIAALRAEQKRSNGTGRFLGRLGIVLGVVLAVVLVIALLVSEANRVNCGAARNAPDIARYC